MECGWFCGLKYSLSPLNIHSVHIYSEPTMYQALHQLQRRPVPQLRTSTLVSGPSPPKVFNSKISWNFTVRQKKKKQIVIITLGFLGGSVVKNLPANAGDAGSTTGSGRSLGEGNGNPNQYSCLGNSMDRGAWRTTVHGVARVGQNLVTKQQVLLHARCHASTTVTNMRPPQRMRGEGQTHEQMLLKTVFSESTWKEHESCPYVLTSGKLHRLKNQ